MKKYILMLMTLFCMVSCGSDGDEQQPLPPDPVVDGGDTDDDEAMKRAQEVARLCTYGKLGELKTGNVFTVILAADGYTKAEIDNGTYNLVLNNAKDVLFDMEPMKSLKNYVNVLTITVPSNHSGIGTKKGDTAFRTYVGAGNATDVYGDSISAQYCAAEALVRMYNITQQEVLDWYMRNSLCIMLLNSNAYKGVTLLAEDKSVVDRIPGGWSLSYVPARATFEGTDVFKDLIQHEGVGHGIAKLGDEYVIHNAVPAQESITQWRSGNQVGFFQNISYAPSDLPFNSVTAIESTSWLYPLAVNAAYGDEDVQWYVGGFEYSRHFRRCSEYSVMNATTDKALDPQHYNPFFNVAGRAMLYKRLMRVVNGNSWKFDSNINDFIDNFDLKARQEIAAYKASQNAAAAKVQSVPYYIEGKAKADAPQLQAPKVIKPMELKLDR